MSIKRYVGIGKELSFGNAVPATKYIDVESAEMDPSGDAVLIYEGVSGLDRIVKAGSYTSTGSISTLVDSDTIGDFLRIILGGYSKEGTTAPYTHTFYPLQAPLMESVTIRVGKDNFEHVFSGVVPTGINLELDGEFLKASIDLQGGKDTKGEVAENPTFSSGNIYASHDVTMVIGDNDSSARVEAFNISIQNGADMEAGITIGSRFPRRAFRGSMVVEGEISLSFFDTSELERFWGGTTGPVETVSEFPVTINCSTDLDILLPRVIYTNVSQPLSGRGRIEQTASFRALITPDGNGPIQFTIENDVVEYQ